VPVFASPDRAATRARVAPERSCRVLTVSDSETITDRQKRGVDAAQIEDGFLVPCPETWKERLG
jgi:hypothetical protein